MKQTAVEWLVEYLKLHGIELNNDAIHNVINQSKEMEKEQIEKAHIDGGKNKRTAVKYYNETFKS
jgi:prophage maintenance system killer protein